MHHHSVCTTCNLHVYIHPYHLLCLTQEIRSRYPSYDGRYRDYKSTFEAESEYEEPEAEFPPMD